MKLEQRYCFRERIVYNAIASYRGEVFQLLFFIALSSLLFCEITIFMQRPRVTVKANVTPDSINERMIGNSKVWCDCNLDETRQFIYWMKLEVHCGTSQCLRIFPILQIWLGSLIEHRFSRPSAASYVAPQNLIDFRIDWKYFRK